MSGSLRIAKAGAPAKRALRKPDKKAGTGAAYKKDNEKVKRVLAFSRRGGELDAFLAGLKGPSLEGIERARSGINVGLVGEYASRIGMPKEQIFSLIDLSRSTAHRLEEGNKPLDRLRSDAFAGTARVIEKARRMLASDEAVRRWLLASVPALDFRTPQELMDTHDGRQVVSNLLDRIQSGAYA